MLLPFVSAQVALCALGFDVDDDEADNLGTAVDTARSGRVTYASFVQTVERLAAQQDPTEYLMSTFSLFDHDNTGKISVSNLRQVAESLGEKLSSEEVQAMVDEFDRDQDGYISASEFLYIMQQAH